LIKEGSLVLEKYVKRSFKQRVSYLKEIDVEKDVLVFLFNDILLQCKLVHSESYELQRTMRLTLASPASLVVHEWMQPSPGSMLQVGDADEKQVGGGMLDGKELLRVMDEDVILYFSGASHEVPLCLMWFVLMRVVASMDEGH
jgi:hypothetical protein